MKVLAIIDMQKDFIDGALGTKEAVSIVPKVAARLKKAREDGETVVFTRDTHHADYLSTQEGRKLPVPHCMEETAGWQIDAALPVLDAPVFDKPGFGSPALIDYLKRSAGAGARRVHRPLHGYLRHYERNDGKGRAARGSAFRPCGLLCRCDPRKPRNGAERDEDVPDFDPLSKTEPLEQLFQRFFFTILLGTARRWQLRLRPVQRVFYCCRCHCRRACR